MDPNQMPDNFFQWTTEQLQQNMEPHQMHSASPQPGPSNQTMWQPGTSFSSTSAYLDFLIKNELWDSLLRLADLLSTSEDVPDSWSFSPTFLDFVPDTLEAPGTPEMLHEMVEMMEETNAIAAPRTPEMLLEMIDLMKESELQAARNNEAGIQRPRSLAITQNQQMMAENNEQDLHNKFMTSMQNPDVVVEPFIQSPFALETPPPQYDRNVMVEQWIDQYRNQQEEETTSPEEEKEMRPSPQPQLNRSAHTNMQNLPLHRIVLTPPIVRVPGDPTSYRLYFMDEHQRLIPGYLPQLVIFVRQDGEEDSSTMQEQSNQITAQNVTTEESASNNNNQLDETETRNIHTEETEAVNNASPTNNEDVDNISEITLSAHYDEDYDGFGPRDVLLINGHREVDRVHAILDTEPDPSTDIIDVLDQITDLL